MGSKKEPAKFDCYANALPDEPLFILLGRDPFAPDLVDDWAVKRQRDILLGFRPFADQAMVDEAQACATSMREWRKANDGAWRKPREPFLSASCEGERCHCGAPAKHKVEETIFHDDPAPHRHPLTTYVCHEHFRQMMGPAAQ